VGQTVKNKCFEGKITGNVPGNVPEKIRYNSSS